MEKQTTEDIGKFSHHYPKLAAIVTASFEGKDRRTQRKFHREGDLK